MTVSVTCILCSGSWKPGVRNVHIFTSSPRRSADIMFFWCKPKVSSHQKCPHTKSVLSPKVPSHQSVLSPKVSSHHKCPLTKSFPSPKVSSHQKCHLTKSFPSPKVSSHQKFPLTKSVLMKRPPLRNVADHKTSLVTKHPSNKMCPKVYFNFRGKYLPLVVFFFFKVAVLLL